MQIDGQKKNILLALLMIFVILGGSLLIIFMNPIFGITYTRVSAEILFVTAVIVAWYAYESAESNKLHGKELEEIRAQTDAKIMPYLSIKWSGKDEVFQIVNDGNGIALDVQFGPLKLKNDLSCQIKSRSLIAPHSQSIITNKELSEGLVDQDIKGFYQEAGGTILKEGIYKEIKIGFKLKVHYEDIRRRSYEVLFATDEKYIDMFRIKSQERNDEEKKVINHKIN